MMHHDNSVNDELQAFKRRMAACGKTVISIEKVGNGNMSAFTVLYRHGVPAQTVRDYFWRHDMDRFLDRMEGSSAPEA